MAWIAKGTAGHETHGQSAVYDEETGRDIAIVYDGKAHAALIARAPSMLARLKDVLRCAERDNASLPVWAIRVRDEIAEAEGGAP